MQSSDSACLEYVKPAVAHLQMLRHLQMLHQVCLIMILYCDATAYMYI